MTTPAYRLPAPRGELALSLAVGSGFAVALFLGMALVQMLGDVQAPKSELEETLVAFDPPEIEQVEEEPRPPPEEESPPELASEPPQLSLEQLDIALNIGTGGSLAGDFSMPAIHTSQQALGTEDFVDFSELDQIPRPVGVAGFDFPRRLRQKAVEGRIVLLVDLDPEGKVLDVQVESSTLPEFEGFVVGEVERWRFTPPTKGGLPVKTRARFPIPIRIR